MSATEERLLELYKLLSVEENRRMIAIKIDTNAGYKQYFSMMYHLLAIEVKICHRK